MEWLEFGDGLFGSWWLNLLMLFYVGLLVFVGVCFGSEILVKRAPTVSHFCDLSFISAASLNRLSAPLDFWASSTPRRISTGIF